MGRRFIQTQVVACAAALGLASACSLMIEFEERTRLGPSEVAQQNLPDAGAPSDGPPGAGSPRDAGADADAGGLEPEGSTDAALPSSPAFAAPYLAFIEDPAEDVARLRLVDTLAALEGSSAGGQPSWRRSLVPSAQTGNALDFAWSPDGQRVALRYESLSGPRLAFFAAPLWQELPLDELDDPASQPVLTATARYAWSPDARTLAVEMVSAEGPFLAGFALLETSARALQPVAFSTGVESLAWFSSELLLTIQPSADAREVIALELVGGELGEQRVLPSGTFLSPLELRRAPTGVLAASREPLSWFYFWPDDAEPEIELGYTEYAYISAGQRFVAETDDSAATASLQLLGGSGDTLDTLPDCPVVLAWGEGASASSLSGSKVACLRVVDGAATLGVHVYGSGGVRSTLVLDSEALRADFAVPDDWQGYARAFSPDNAWLALTLAERDVLVDLRTGTPNLLELPNTLPGATARAFSPSGRYLLSQRGQQLRLTVLSGTPAGIPLSIPLPLPDAATEPVPCSSAPHVEDWCGAPSAARGGSARWSSQRDIAALLSRDEGLLTLSIGAQGQTLVRTSVSTCGAACVGQYSFNP
jgi:hypothetical protein